MEFVIWGIANGDPDEQLLLTTHRGEPIASRHTAEILLAKLIAEHGCKNCRIQALDGSLPNFTNTLN